MSLPDNKTDRILLIAIMVIIIGQLVLAVYGDGSRLIKGYGKTRVLALKCILNVGLIFFLLRRMSIGWVIAYSLQILTMILLCFVTVKEYQKKLNPPRSRRIESLTSEADIALLVGMIVLSIFVLVVLRRKAIRAYFAVSDRSQRITTWVALGILAFLSVFGMTLERVFQKSIPL